METLNKYLGILPTIKNSPLAVASMEFGNVPFTEATHASIILSHLLVAWRNQYNLTHKTVPELPHAMLLVLENIEKPCVKRYNKRARTNKAKVASAANAAELGVPKKRAHGGGSNKGAPKKGCSAKYCKWCKVADGPFTTHYTIECCRFSKDGSPKDKLVVVEGGDYLVREAKDLFVPFDKIGSGLGVSSHRGRRRWGQVNANLIAR